MQATDVEWDVSTNLTHNFSYTLSDKYMLLTFKDGSDITCRTSASTTCFKLVWAEIGVNSGFVTGSSTNVIWCNS